MSENNAETSLRIVLLGKSGVGRSSLANTIFGEKLFSVNHGISSSKRKCEAQTGSINGRRLTLVDTPGFLDPDRSEEELKPEILGCISQCSPGPHAFLILLKAQIFTEQEKDVITKICQYFSEEVLKYAVVVFTCGDQLPEGTKIEEFVNQNKDLSDLMKKCSGRCHIVDNKYWKNKQQDEHRSNQFQVAQLLNTIEKMVKNRGGCYTAKMLQEWQETQEKIIESPSFLNIFKYLKTFLSKRSVMAVGALIFGVLISKMMKTKAEMHSIL